MRSFRLEWAAMGVAMTLVMPKAHGQTAASPGDLFERGVQRMEAEDFAGGCPLIQVSYNREPKDGRLVALAKCRDGEGKIATALEHYRAYLRAFETMKPAARKSHAEREQFARKRVQEIEAVVPRLKMVWRGDIPHDVKVLVNGKDALSQINREWRLDPGNYIWEIVRGGSVEEWRIVTLQPGAPIVVVDLTLSAAEAAPTPRKPAKRPRPSPPVPLNIPKSEILPSLVLAQQGDNSAQQLVGFGLMGLGVTGAVLGAVVMRKAVHEKGIVDAHCPRGQNGFDCTDKAGITAAQNTRLWGDMGTAVAVVGGAAFVTGLVLALKRPTPTQAIKAQVSVNAGRGFVSVEGEF